MTPSPRHPRPAEDIKDILDWLATALPQDAAEDLARLSGELAALERAKLEEAHFHRILDLFHERALRLSKALKSHLHGTDLPLDKEMRAKMALTVSACLEIAAGYERLLTDIARLARSKRRNPATVAARALRCLAEALESSFMMARPAPPDLWRRAHGLARTAREHCEDTIGIKLEPEKIYKGMLALAAAQPEGLTPNEIALASEYLEQFSAAVSLQSRPQEDGAWYWIDLSGDLGPIPPHRRIPPRHGDLLYCSFHMLARLLQEQMAALEGGTPVGNLRLPERASGPGGIAALKRLQTHWANPPHRHHARRSQNYRAQICIGLSELWHLLEQGDTPRGIRAVEQHLTEWMVLNESPSGYAVMHVAGRVDGLAPGSVIALRSGRDLPWNICIVRWMKSENPEHIELGLELVSPSARSVQLIFRNNDPSQQPTPGLLLPAVPALREHEAVLAPSGAYTARRFFIVSGEDKTHVMQGRLLSLDLQTGSVELFQFEPDPYPL